MPGGKSSTDPPENVINDRNLASDGESCSMMTSPFGETSESDTENGETKIK